MKRLGLALIHFFVFACAAFSQSQLDGGVRIGPQMATRNTHETGYFLGFILRQPAKKTNLKWAFGAAYVNMIGKKEFTGSTQIASKDISCFQVFVGPQIGGKNGFYFMPSLAADFGALDGDSGEIQLGAGSIVPISEQGFKLDIGGTFSVQKPFKGGGHANMIRINMGVIY
jgi:hypothetical protein